MIDRMSHSVFDFFSIMNAGLFVYSFQKHVYYSLILISAAAAAYNSNRPFYDRFQYSVCAVVVV